MGQEQKIDFTPDIDFQADTPDSQPQVQASAPGLLERTWQAANTPIVTVGTPQFRKINEELAHPGLNTSPLEARIKGFISGAGEGVMDVISSLSSPLNIAAEALGVASAVPGIAGKIGSTGTKAIAGSVGAHGMYNVGTGVSEGNLGKIGTGALELGTAGLGLKQGFKGELERPVQIKKRTLEPVETQIEAPNFESLQGKFNEALGVKAPVSDKIDFVPNDLVPNEAPLQERLDIALNDIDLTPKQLKESLLSGETGALTLRGFKKDETKSLRDTILGQLERNENIDLAAIYGQHADRITPHQFNKVVLDIIDSGSIDKIRAKARQNAEAAKPIIQRDLGTAQTPEEAIDILLDNVKNNATARIEQDQLVSSERKSRIRQAMRESNKAGGYEGYLNSLKKLKGEYPKVQAQMRAELASPENVNFLMDTIKNHPELSDWDKIGTQTALAKALGLRGETGALQPSEIRDLTKVFGEQAAYKIQSMHSGLFLPESARTYEGISKLGGYAKSLKASVDFPGFFRAGINYAGQEEWRNSILPAMKSYFRPEYADNVLEQLKKDPIYKAAHDNGLAITDYRHASPLKREESIASLDPEKIPVLGKAVAASNRGQTVFADVLRLEKYKSLSAKYKTLYESLKKSATPEELPELEKLNPESPYRGRLIADEINVATGRGKLPGKLEHLAGDLNNLFFSPRLMSARIRSLNRVLSPAGYIKYIAANPMQKNLMRTERIEALKQLFSIAGVLGSTTGIANLMGYSTGTQWLSTDYLKSKRGDTRIDPLGGYQQLIVPAIRLLKGAIVSSEGNPRLLGDFGAPTGVDIAERFLENKASPFLSFAMTLANRQEMDGKPLDFRNLNPMENTATRQLVVPMILQDMYDLFTHEPDLMQTFAIVPASLGMGVQTYNKDDNKEAKDKRKLERKEALQKLKASLSR